jgi:hypothetical protein
MAYTDPIDYADDAGSALARNSAIGFASMSAYDVYKGIKEAVAGKKKVNLRSQVQTVALKGMYGVIFCNVTQMFK